MPTLTIGKTSHDPRLHRADEWAIDIDLSHVAGVRNRQGLGRMTAPIQTQKYSFCGTKLASRLQIDLSQCRRELRDLVTFDSQTGRHSFTTVTVPVATLSGIILRGVLPSSEVTQPIDDFEILVLDRYPPWGLCVGYSFLKPRFSLDATHAALVVKPSHVALLCPIGRRGRGLAVP